MTNTTKVTVLGGGSFGTAIANKIAANGVDTTLWMRDAARAQLTQQTRENRSYAPGYRLDDHLRIHSDLALAVDGSQTVFVSIPSAAFREVIQQLRAHLPADAMVVSTTKGISTQRKATTGKSGRSDFVLMSEIIKDELPGVPLGVLSGPNFAKEMMQGQLTGTVIASEDAQVIAAVQACLRSATLRVYSNNDCYGVELAGALKNIYALIAGMAQARDYGHNTMALLITRALSEMGRFAHALGADPMTFLGLSGVGDLILTCNSSLSRNYRVGHAMGCGKSLTSAMREVGQVVEGVNTLRLVKENAEKMSIPMPLVSALYALLFEGACADSIIQQLMSSEQNSDVDFTGAIVG
ncbi:MAG: NAD(P)H-dependent glycerol-3-phosphate dehydrogenase [Cellvibrionaceae bacterium]|nr:NAD(P)H-dependent glycerol-3-phosphate dehydrogenase [Cellvibrionaceae bacterium]